jgi:hypothetical protein
MWKFVCFGVMKFWAINFLLRQLQVTAATGLVAARSMSCVQRMQTM